ncbi:hypothetical protein VTK26DRAFT_2021 [Humicola hyalothermophila]
MLVPGQAQKVRMQRVGNAALCFTPPGQSCNLQAAPRPKVSPSMGGSLQAPCLLARHIPVKNPALPRSSVPIAAVGASACGWLHR